MNQMPLSPERDTTKKMRGKVGRQSRAVSCANLSSEVLVDVTGIEPVTPCLQNSPTSSCNPCHFNQPKENSKLNSSSGVWLYVRKCISLHVRSLQKSLQYSATAMGAIA